MASFYPGFQISPFAAPQYVNNARAAAAEDSSPCPHADAASVYAGLDENGRIGEGGPAAPAARPSSFYGAPAGGPQTGGGSVFAAMSAARSARAAAGRARMRKAIEAARSAAEIFAVVETGLSEFDAFASTLAVHRLARYGKPEAQWVRAHASWPALAARQLAVLESRSEPRHCSSTLWAFANLRHVDQAALDVAAERCILQEGGEWDSMSCSLIPWSFAVLRAKHDKLFNSVVDKVRASTSATWPPGDLARVCWSMAKVLHKDDAFFRHASLRAVSRISEFRPGELTQTIWSFGTLAPAEATAHLFPQAEQVMSGGALEEYTPQHIAMVVWSFAAILFRPKALLAEIGDAVASKFDSLNSQDISMTAWSFTTLLAPEEMRRRIFGTLASAAVRRVGDFNAQDLSNTAWAFAAAGENRTDLLDAVAEEVCNRELEFGCQHLAMALWAFTTLRHRHDRIFEVVGRACKRNGLGSWHSAKLVAFALASLSRMDACLGSRDATLEVARALVAMAREQIGEGGCDADDAWVVHDGVSPWLEGGGGLRDVELPAGWTDVDSLVERVGLRLQAVMESPVFDIAVNAQYLPDWEAVRTYQEAVQALGVRGLGNVHSWRFLRQLGLARAGPQLASVAAETRAATIAEGMAGPGSLDFGRGERQNWCFFRARCGAASDGPGSVELPGRLLNSSVLGYREDNAGLVAVKLHHDRVSHRSWDAEFRGLALFAAAARTLLGGPNGVAERPDGRPEPAARGSEDAVEGHIQLYMTEVPCLSCICVMAQFRRRFPRVVIEVDWVGLPIAVQ